MEYNQTFWKQLAIGEVDGRRIGTIFVVEDYILTRELENIKGYSTETKSEEEPNRKPHVPEAQ